MKSVLGVVLLLACATTGGSGVCPAKPTCATYLKLECRRDERSGCDACRCVDRSTAPNREGTLPPPSQPPPIR